MGNTRESLNPDFYFHVFNHAIGNENLFREEKNYEFFLQKFAKWILPASDLYAYCLMPNHFHFLLKIKDENELAILFDEKIKRKLNKSSPIPEGVSNPFGDDVILRKRTGEIIAELITEQFSHCFNSYVQAYNKSYSRMGALMKESFHRKKIDSDDYLRKVICYIHNNPVSHRFVSKPEEWKYSSYNALLSDKPTKIERKQVIELFDSIENLIYEHKNNLGMELD